MAGKALAFLIVNISVDSVVASSIHAPQTPSRPIALVRKNVNRHEASLDVETVFSSSGDVVQQPKASLAQDLGSESVPTTAAEASSVTSIGVSSPAVEAYPSPTVPSVDDVLLFASGADDTAAELFLAAQVDARPLKDMTMAERCHAFGSVVIILMLTGVLVASPQKEEADHNLMSLRIPTRALGVTTLVLLQVCYVITSYYALIGSSAEVHVPGSAHLTYAPKALVLAQLLWNAAQVAQLCLLICFRTSCRSWLLCSTSFITIGLLPLSVYVVSPGGHVFAAITFICALVAVRDGGDVQMQILDGPPHQDLFGQRAVQHLCKLEYLAFLCNLGSSMYNMHSRDNPVPYYHICQKASSLFGFTIEPGILVNSMYKLGLHMEVPAFIPSAAGNNLAALMFLMIWSILPFLYTTYFVVLFVMSAHMPRSSMIVQRVLCLFGILHFLLLTDGVDYKYGRGMRNPASGAYHWSERWAWRIALLLPIYQKVAMGHWKQGHSHRLIGVGVHYFVAAFGFAVLVGCVLLEDVPHFSEWVFGDRDLHERMSILGHEYFHSVRYYSALAMMVCVYGFCVLQMRCYHITVAATE